MRVNVDKTKIRKINHSDVFKVLSHYNSQNKTNIIGLYMN